MRSGCFSAVFVLLLCASLNAENPASSETTERSAVPRRRIRRIYNGQIQMQKPSSAAAPSELPPQKEEFIPAGAQAASREVEALVQPSSISFPPSVPAPAPKPITGEEESGSDLWVLEPVDVVLGASTNIVSSKDAGKGWLAREIATQTKEKSERDNPEEDSESRPLRAGDEKASPTLFTQPFSMGSRLPEKPSTPSRYGLLLRDHAQQKTEDRFTPTSSDPADHTDSIADAQTQMNMEVQRNTSLSKEIFSVDLAGSEPEKWPEPPDSSRPESTLPSAPQGGSSAQWEPQPSSSVASDPSSIEKYGRIGAIFSPSPESRSPFSSPSLNPTPTDRPGTIGTSTDLFRPTNPFQSVEDLNRTLLPPVQNLRSSIPSTYETKPFLPGRYNP